MEFSLLGAAAIAVACFWAMLRWEAPRGNAAGCAVDLWEAGLTSAVAGVFIGRVVAMATTGINPISDPGQILLIRSGVSTTPAALGAVAVFAVFARRDLVTAADAIAPAALAGLAGWHAGCVTSNACLGVESGVPWAWSLPGSTVTRHPVELYVAIGLALAAGVLAMWKRRGRPLPGVVAGLAVASAGFLRLATEPLRISIDGGPVAMYLIAAVVGVGWTTVAVLADRRITGTG
ncbi:MAG: prolipoprotein diacylglyceryl transferase [Acidimicrobiia bacterium]